MEYQPFDLIGDPVDPNHGGRGRRRHVANDDKRRLVVTLCAFGRSIEEIAAALTITPPTLRRHYKKQLIVKEKARVRLEAKMLSALMAQVDLNNVAAVRELRKMIEAQDLKFLAASAANRQPAPAALGKKEALAEAAKRVAGLYAPPPAPRAVN